MTQDGQRRTRKPLVVNLAWATALAILLAMGYVASYPIAVRITDSTDLPAYRTVEWLIDNTPLAQPILQWADCCGVGFEVAIASNLREVDRVRVKPLVR
jgi:hypothetical protein